MIYLNIYLIKLVAKYSTEYLPEGIGRASYTTVSSKIQYGVPTGGHWSYKLRHG
jgi:hypothetical protein